MVILQSKERIGKRCKNDIRDQISFWGNVLPKKRVRGEDIIKAEIISDASELLNGGEENTALSHL